MAGITFSGLTISGGGLTAAPPPPPPAATGGTITTVGNYKIHTFTSDGTFTVTAPGTFEALLVAEVPQGHILAPQEVEQEVCYTDL